MFSFSNVKERILENKIKKIQEHIDKKIGGMDSDLHDMKKRIEELGKEYDALRKEGVSMKKVEEELKKSEEVLKLREDELKKSEEELKSKEEELKKDEEELKKGTEEIRERIKAGGLLQEQTLPQAAQTSNTQQWQEADWQEEDKIEHSDKKKKNLRKGKGKIPEEPKHVEPYEKASNARSMETPLDKLLEMVTAKGKIRIDQAAKAFHVNENQISEWASILEEHNLIEIHYPAIGKPMLKAKGRK